MRRAFVLLLFMLAGAAGAQSPDTRIRVYTEPADAAWLSQQIRLFVEVSADTGLRTTPDFPELQVDGAIVLSPDAFGVNFTRERGNRRYTGQRRSYLVFPQRTGPLRIPPVTVGVVVADGATGRRELKVSTQPVTLDISMPPGAGSLEQIVSLPNLSLTERYTGLTESLEVGDAFTRSVTVSGQDTLALILPQMRFRAPEGVAVYRNQPRLVDGSSRGRYNGTRVDSATYVLEREGRFTLPPVTLHWWNTATNSLQTETLPGLRLDVRAAALPALARSIAVEDQANVPGFMRGARRVLDWLVANMEFISLGIGLYYVGWLAWRRFLPAWRERFDARRVSRQRSERDQFRHFAQACRGGDERAARQAFWRWVNALGDDPAAAHAFDEIWGEFASRRYGRERSAGQMDTRRLLRSATRWRKERRRERRRRRERAVQRLNPRGRGGVF